MSKYILLLLPLFFSYDSSAQNESIKELWKPLLSQAGLANYFSGIFESLGIQIEETGEKVTILHLNSHFEMIEGVDEDKVDYYVSLKLENITNMSAHGADGQIDANESYRIMRVLFTPLTKSALENPMMNKSFAQKMAHIENHIHVYLESPAKDEYVAHSLIYINKKWVVIEGIHGDAKRIFRMSPNETIEYQREVFKAQKINTRKSWKTFLKFYLKWRETVSVEVN